MTSTSERQALTTHYRWTKATAARMIERAGQMILAVDPDLAAELGIEGAEPKPSVKTTSTTYAAAMDGWTGKLSQVLALRDPVALLRQHPWTAANIPDPAEWLALQRAKAPGVLTDQEYRDQLAAALAWMNDKGKAVAGRKEAGRYLGAWLSRSMERRRANASRYDGQQTTASLDFDDAKTRAKVTGGKRG